MGDAFQNEDINMPTLHREAMMTGTTIRPSATLPDDIQAVLFDLDATLIDAKTAHLGQVVAFLQAHLPVRETPPRRDGGNAATVLVGRAVECREHARVRPVSLERRVGRMIAACYTRLRRHVALDAETRRVCARDPAAGRSAHRRGHEWLPPEAPHDPPSRSGSDGLLRLHLGGMWLSQT